MSLLFETIKVVNNSLLNLDYHNARVNKARKDLFNEDGNWDIGKMIELATLNESIVYKCRFVYHRELVTVEFHPYIIKPINTLQLIENQDIEYRYKFLDRSELDIIKFSNQQTDDVIFIQNQRLTDISYANIVFFDGEKWLTPATPLLNGTKRQKYIEEQVIEEEDLKVFDLRLFKKARIINAMIDLEECPDIRMENIF
jgi:4-amino-4-deoxychorismate lyase